ncbi:MAG: ABC transporter permease [Burkholderiales bacterium]|nr:ABC transporter permease [Burkholderiales bacterium]MBH2015494.1 ABC transporter permease [Burkholderiales bacterium]
MAFNRISAIAIKELLHMVRDRLTFVSLLSVTIGYVIVFGYAINPDPRHIPTIVVDHDKSEFSRLYKAALQQSVYLEIDPRQLTSDQASEMLRKAQTSVVIEIPPDFSRKLMRGLPAQILVEADATDPVSLNGAITSTGEVARQTAAHLFRRDGIETEITGQPQLEVRVQRRFNPQGEQTFFIIPGLVGMILNVSLLVMTAMSITKEKEQGSMEFLLVTPTEPWEMIIGKIIPTFLVGVIQVSIILMIAFFLFKLPLTGDPLALIALLLAYGITTLAVGILISTLAMSQMQAMQLSFFYFLPSILLSGFMFPYSGMPGWAQVISQGLPLTYFVRGSRGVFLKEFTLIDMWPHLWPIMLAGLIFSLLAIKSYRRTLN